MPLSCGIPFFLFAAIVIAHDIDFHNVAELEDGPCASGPLLQRYPRHVREKLGYGGNFKGRRVAQQPSGCEIRFVTEASISTLRLMALDGDAEVLIYSGDFFHSRQTLRAGVVSTLALETNERLGWVHGEYLRQGSFAPEVWRVVFGRGAQIAFLGLDTLGRPRRPPGTHEVPARRLLCYGSSITQGHTAQLQHTAYVHQAAQRLGMDALNLGLSGACLAEPEVADWIASRKDWDSGFFEIGVNMRKLFDATEFESRLRYLIAQLARHRPDAPVFFTTLYPNYASHMRTPGPFTADQSVFNEIIPRVFREIAAVGMHLIDGASIVRSPSYLTDDLIHPSDFGHVMMGQHLAEALATCLGDV